jgi:hypothetical protein
MEKVHKFQQIYNKMWLKKMFNEGNQIHNFMSSSGSGTVINYGSGSGSDFLTSYGSGSGSTSQKVTGPTVPVPQHCVHIFLSVSNYFVDFVFVLLTTRFFPCEQSYCVTNTKVKNLME